jgi:hypothetical protein
VPGFLETGTRPSTRVGLADYVTPGDGTVRAGGDKRVFT